MIPKKIAEAFVESEIDGEWIVMNIETGDFHSMQRVAPAIWAKIDGRRTLADIQTEIASRYAVDRTTCDADVAAFIEELRQAGLVNVA